MYDKALADAIIANLSDDLRKPVYQGHSNPLHGHCYVASEAYYHLCVYHTKLVPCWVKHEGTTHWFLVDKALDGSIEVIDLTAGQFSSKVPYDEATPCGFLTKKPSKRAKKLINRIKDKLDDA